MRKVSLIATDLELDKLEDVLQKCDNIFHKTYHYEVVFVCTDKKYVTYTTQHNVKFVEMTTSTIYNEKIACALKFSEGACTMIVDFNETRWQEYVQSMLEAWENGANIVNFKNIKKDTFFLAKVKNWIRKRMLSMFNLFADKHVFNTFELYSHDVVEIIKADLAQSPYIRASNSWLDYKEVTLKVEQKQKRKMNWAKKDYNFWLALGLLSCFVVYAGVMFGTISTTLTPDNYKTYWVSSIGGSVILLVFGIVFMCLTYMQNKYLCVNYNEIRYEERLVGAPQKDADLLKEYPQRVASRYFTIGDELRTTNINLVNKENIVLQDEGNFKSDYTWEYLDDLLKKKGIDVVREREELERKAQEEKIQQEKERLLNANPSQAQEQSQELPTSQQELVQENLSTKTQQEKSKTTKQENVQEQSKQVVENSLQKQVVENSTKEQYGITEQANQIDEVKESIAKPKKETKATSKSQKKGTKVSTDKNNFVESDEQLQESHIEDVIETNNVVVSPAIAVDDNAERVGVVKNINKVEPTQLVEDGYKLTNIEIIVKESVVENIVAQTKPSKKIKIEKEENKVVNIPLIEEEGYRLTNAELVILEKVVIEQEDEPKQNNDIVKLEDIQDEALVQQLTALNQKNRGKKRYAIITETEEIITETTETIEELDDKENSNSSKSKVDMREVEVSQEEKEEYIKSHGEFDDKEYELVHLKSGEVKLKRRKRDKSEKKLTTRAFIKILEQEEQQRKEREEAEKLGLDVSTLQKQEPSVKTEVFAKIEQRKAKNAEERAKRVSTRTRSITKTISPQGKTKLKEAKPLSEKNKTSLAKTRIKTAMDSKK